MAQLQRRYSDQQASISRQHISRLAFLLAGLLIAVTSASLVFVGYIASEASKRQAIDNEKQLFANTLSDRMRLVVREQSNVARADLTVKHVVRDFDVDYVRDNLRALWSDHGHNKVLIVSGSRRIRAESFQEYVHITDRPLSETPALLPVIEQVEALYNKNRVRVPGGYSHQSLQGLAPNNYAAIGFAVIDGRPAMVGAMPIMPNFDTVTLPDGPPTILISAKYIDANLLSDLNAQLSFQSLAFSVGLKEQIDGPAHLIKNFGDDALGGFTWQSSAQGMTIWPTVVPVVMILSFLLAALAFGIAWRIGQLTSSLHASERQNRFLALHDTLSGLANRLQFNRVLATAVDGLPGKPFAILHCDLDLFKQVNDTLGHAAGDKVIQTVAERMATIVDKNGLVARIGGDEFVILMRAYTAPGRLSELAVELMTSVRQPITITPDSFAEVGLSIGIAIAPDAGDTAEAIMAAADAALYHSKENGRGKAAFHTDAGLAVLETGDPEPPRRAIG